MDSQFWDSKTSLFRTVMGLNKDLNGYIHLLNEREDLFDDVMLEENLTLLLNAQWKLELLIDEMFQAGFFDKKQEMSSYMEYKKFLFTESTFRLRQATDFLVAKELSTYQKTENLYYAGLELEKIIVRF